MKISVLMIYYWTGESDIHKIFWNDEKARKEINRMKKKHKEDGMILLPSYRIEEWEITE